MFRKPVPRRHPVVGHLAVRGISQRSVAQAIGYHENYVSSVFRGLQPVSPEFARRVSEFVGLPADDLFDPAETAAVAS